MIGLVVGQMNNGKRVKNTRNENETHAVNFRWSRLPRIYQIDTVTVIRDVGNWLIAFSNNLYRKPSGTRYYTPYMAIKYGHAGVSTWDFESKAEWLAETFSEELRGLDGIVSLPMYNFFTGAKDSYDNMIMMSTLRKAQAARELISSGDMSSISCFDDLDMAVTRYLGSIDEESEQTLEDALRETETENVETGTIENANRLAQEVQPAPEPVNMSVWYHHKAKSLL